MLSETTIDDRNGSIVERTKKDVQLVVDFIDQHLNKTSIVYQKVLEATNHITTNLLITSNSTSDSIVSTAMDSSSSSNGTNDNEDNSNITMEVDTSSKLSNELLTLKIHLNYTNYSAVLSSDSTSIINVQVLPSESIYGLCKKVEDTVFGCFRSRVIVERVSNRRTNRAWSSNNTKCLQECDITNLDEITVDCRSCSIIDVVELSPVSDPFLQRLNQFNIIPSTPLELLCLALHSLMIDEQFIPVVELPNTVAGFAPSIKELPKGSFIPPDWNKDRFSAGFMYKHKLKPGKHFLLTLRWSSNSDTYLLSLSQKKGVSYEVAVDMKRYTTATEESLKDIDRSMYVSSFLLHGDELKATLQDLIYTNNLLPLPAVPELNLPHRNYVDESKYTVESPTLLMETLQPPYSSQQNNINNNKIHFESSNTTYDRYNAHNKPNIVVGNADLNPFPTGIWIGPQSNSSSSSTSSSSMPNPLGPLPGTGSFVGPDHPIFQKEEYGYDDNDDNDYNRNASIFDNIPPQYLPQPRFDPFGPVLGPNCDYSVGNVGIDGRGRRGGGRDGRRGGGRGSLYPGRGSFPGEPNPDHLKPPGW